MTSPPGSTLNRRFCRQISGPSPPRNGLVRIRRRISALAAAAITALGPIGFADAVPLRQPRPPEIRPGVPLVPLPRRRPAPPGPGDDREPNGPAAEVPPSACRARVTPDL